MILERHYLGCLAHASYLVADKATGRAAVIDPQRDVDRYLEDAERLSCRIEHVFLTHFHADFVAGHLELRERTGATIHLGARASAEYPFVPIRDGARVRLGTVQLEVLETPGHSPESISIVLYDSTRSGEQPIAVLTGDTLFIGDVGRPDLRAALGWGARELASMLYDSLHEKLAKLPDDTLVYPTHGAGSLCGRSLSTDAVSTIGAQRRFNYALQPMSRERFIEMVIADLPDAPPYFTYDAVLNTRSRPTLEEALASHLKPLTLDRALELVKDGAQLLDARDPEAFATAHLRGSVNVGLEGNFASWCGTVLDPDRPIVLVTDPGREIETATRLGRIGFDDVAGYLEGGMHALDGRARELVEQTERITPRSLAESLAGATPPLLVDVRSPAEWEERGIEGAINLPLSRLVKRSGELAACSSIVVHCTSGYRSSIAASVLRHQGVDSVADLAGGLEAWDAATPATTRTG